MKQLNLIKRFLTFSFMMLMMFAATNAAYSQGVTTSSISGKVYSTDGETLPGALVTAIHTPSGTKYSTVSNNEGRYFIANKRIGGPYVVYASFVGYSQSNVGSVFLSLGVTSNVQLELKTDEISVDEVVVVGEKNPVFSS